MFVIVEKNIWEGGLFFLPQSSSENNPEEAQIWWETENQFDVKFSTRQTYLIIFLNWQPRLLAARELSENYEI